MICLHPYYTLIVTTETVSGRSWLVKKCLDCGQRFRTVDK